MPIADKAPVSGNTSLTGGGQNKKVKVSIKQYGSKNYV
jgi:hypothetical protein